jgi:hypothetical protein
MIPPRHFPEGVLKLILSNPDGTQTLLEELRTSSKNRDRLNQMRNDLLMVNSTLKITLTENNVPV